MSSNAPLDPEDPTFRGGAMCYDCGAEFEIHVDPDHSAPDEVARVGDGPAAAWLNLHRQRCPGRRPENAPPAGNFFVSGPPSEPFAVWWDAAGSSRRIRSDLCTIVSWRVTSWHVPARPGTYLPARAGEVVYALRETPHGRAPVAVRIESIALEVREGSRFAAAAHVVHGVTALGDRVELVVELGEVFSDPVEAALLLDNPPALARVVDFVQPRRS
jgi:hypothetical protein